MDKTFLSDMNFTDLLEVETDRGTFWISLVPGVRMEGMRAFGLQITSGFGQSSYRPPLETGADNRISRGELWQWGYPGVLHGGLVSKIQFL